MNCCKMVKDALNYRYNQHQGKESELDRRICNGMNIYAKNYKNLFQSGPINHSSFGMRYGFIFKYLPVRASQLKWVIRTNKHSKKMLQEFPNIVVASIGSGPGTDLFGILKVATFYGVSPLINIKFYDNETTWSKTFYALRQHQPLDQMMKTGRVTVEWINIDISNYEAISNNLHLASCNLIILSYVISEVFRDTNNNFKLFIDYLFNNAGQNQIFIIIDNPGFKEHYNYIEFTAVSNNIEMSFSESSTEWRLPLSEQYGELEPYKTRFEQNNSIPLLKPRFVYAVGIKW